MKFESDTPEVWTWITFEELDFIKNFDFKLDIEQEFFDKALMIEGVSQTDIMHNRFKCEYDKLKLIQDAIKPLLIPAIEKVTNRLISRVIDDIRICSYAMEEYKELISIKKQFNIT